MPERHHVGWKRPRYSGSTTYPGHQEDDPSIRLSGEELSGRIALIPKY
jgi:hypothetical protein